MTKKSQKVGFYRKTQESNKRLIKIFEELQRERLKADFDNLELGKKINYLDKKAIKEVLKMLEKGQIQTADDFYRAAMIFQHGESYKSYALAVTLALVSDLLGEVWGKTLTAAAMDRFLLSINQSQYFGTSFEKREGVWELSTYRKEISDKARKIYDIPSHHKLLEEVKRLNRGSAR